MDDQKIAKLMKQRAAVIARLDGLDAELRMLPNPWMKPDGGGRRYSAAARKRMSDAAQERWIRQREF